MYLSWRARHKFLFVWPFSWVLKGENKNSNNNPSDISAGLPVPHGFAAECLVHSIMPTSLGC